MSGHDREAARASAAYVYSSSTTCLSFRLEYNSRFIGLGGWGVRGSEGGKISWKSVDDNGDGLKPTGAS